MKTKEWTLLIAIILVPVIAAFANNNDEIVQQNVKRMKERYAYFKENIKPKIDEQRNKLETSLSTVDKNEVKRIREELIKQRLLENELFSEAHEKRIKGEGFDEGLWEEIEAQRIVIENLLDQAKLIVNKYRPEIDDMVASLRTEIRDEVSKQNFQEDNFNGKYGRGNGPGKGRGNGYGQGPGGNGYGSNNRDGFGYGQGYHRGFGENTIFGFGAGMHGALDTVGFLLWDVNRG